MPIRRSFAPGTAQPNKRHSRLDLTPDMISGPMGDFRHTMHVGRGGDAFGDTSFLKSDSKAPDEAPPPPPDAVPPLPPGGTRTWAAVPEGDEREQQPALPPQPPPPKKESFLARTLRASKRSLSASRRSSRACSPAPSRPLSQSGSLPQLQQQDTGEGVGGVGGAEDRGAGGPGVRASLTRSESAEGPPSQPMFPVKQRPPLVGQRLRPSHTDGGGGAGGSGPVRADHRIFGEGGGGSRANGVARGGSVPDSPPPMLKHAESVLSFHVDLGPSMLGDVLGVMENEKFFHGGGGGSCCDDDDEPPLQIDENLEFLARKTTRSWGSCPSLWPHAGRAGSGAAATRSRGRKPAQGPKRTMRTTTTTAHRGLRRLGAAVAHHRPHPGVWRHG
ncbi:cdc42 effector protein 4-like [Callorhinchus milii]|uniref:cdc42 effector protein 4-like n=1 Tax=Callorhinchus milii TaxID=7868 RepID=UPI001C3F75A8|nr:cdc42 effector protein 4-like [Callorhinchus milii]